MAFFEDGIFQGLVGKGIKSGVGLGIAFGVGALLAGPAAIAFVGSVLRPLAKAAIKGGLVAYDQGRGLFAETKETIEDIVEESKAELSTEYEEPAGRTASSMGTEEASMAMGAGSEAAAFRKAEKRPRDAGRKTERPTPWIVRGY